MNIIRLIKKTLSYLNRRRICICLFDCLCLSVSIVSCLSLMFSELSVYYLVLLVSSLGSGSYTFVTVVLAWLWLSTDHLSRRVGSATSKGSHQPPWCYEIRIRASRSRRGLRLASILQ